MPKLTQRERSEKVLEFAKKEFSKAEYIIFARCVFIDALRDEEIERNTWMRRTSSLLNIMLSQPLKITIGDEFYRFLCEKYSFDDKNRWMNPCRALSPDSVKSACGLGKSTPDAERQFYQEVQSLSAADQKEIETASEQLVRYAFNSITTDDFCIITIHGQQYSLPYNHPEAAAEVLPVPKEQPSGCCGFWRGRHLQKYTDISPLLPQASSNKFCPFSCTLL